MPRTETRHQPGWPPAMEKTRSKRMYWVCVSADDNPRCRRFELTSRASQCECGDGPHSPASQASCPSCGAWRCYYCRLEKTVVTEDITARENIGNGQADAAKHAVDERPSPIADETAGFQNPSTTSRPEIVSKTPAFPLLGPVTSEESQQVAPAGFSTESCAPITDSGYASAVNVLFPCAQPGSSNEKWSPSSRAQGDGGLAEDDVETTYSTATSTAHADARHYISELSHEIVNRLGRSVDVKLLAGQRAVVLPALIKAFGIMIGREHDSQTNRDIMYFVHRHHR